MSPAFDDITEAVHRLRRAFIRNGLKPPTSIEVGSHDDITRLKQELPPEYFLTEIVMRNKPNVIGNILGVDIAAPAEFRALRNGGYDIARAASTLGAKT